MKKRNHRGSIKVTNITVKASNDKIIKVLYDIIKKKEKEKIILDTIFKKKKN